MERDEERIKNEFRDQFHPHEFLEFKLKGLKETDDNYDFWFKCLYEFFTAEKFNGDRLLDLGSGPTYYNVGTASTYFKNIILSDFVDRSCDQLRKWLKKDPDSLDWTPFVKRVAKAEQRTDLDAAVKEIEDRIRSSIKAVIHCDVLKDQVIAPEYCEQPFDLILTSLTLEAAAVNWEAYSKILHRVNGLLRKGGKLIMIGVTKCSFWKCGNAKFNYLPVDESDIQKALEVNGYGDIQWKLQDQPVDDTPFNCEKVFFTTSTKL